MRGGNPCREIQSHRGPGRNQEGGQPVHQACRKLCSRPGKKRQQNQRGCRPRGADDFQPHAQARGGEHGEQPHQQDRAQVRGQRGLSREPPQGRKPRGAVTDTGFQCGPPSIDQIVADVAFHVRPAVCPRSPRRLGCCGRRATVREAHMFDRRAGHLLFVQWAATGNLLHDPAIVIAAGKAHPCVDAGRVLPQDMLDHALALHEFLPVQHGQLAETENALLYREFVGRLVWAGSGERAGYPGTGWGSEGGERGAGSWQSDSLLPAPSSLLLRQAAEVVDQAQPQHAAHRPQFRQRQRRHGLVGAEKMLQTLLVELRIEMGDQLPRQAVDARQTFAAHVEKARQLAESPIAEIPPRRSHQLPKPAEVVNQPRAGGRDRALLGRRPPQTIERILQDAPVVVQPGQQRIAALAVSQPMRKREFHRQLGQRLPVNFSVRRSCGRWRVGKWRLRRQRTGCVRRVAWGLPRPQWALGVSGGQGSHWGGLQSIRLRQSVGWGRASLRAPAHPCPRSWWAGAASSLVPPYVLVSEVKRQQSLLPPGQGSAVRDQVVVAIRIGEQ